MKLSVIVPAYNEAGTIEKVLKRLLKQKQVFQIVVVDDGSIDGTGTKVKKLKSKKVELIIQETNRGKGAAIQTALDAVRGDYVMIQDADLEYDPNDIVNMIKPVLEGKAEVVYGSRFTGPRRNMFFWNMVGNRFLSFMVNILFNTTLSDMESCYKLLPTKIMKELELKENDFGIEPEITCKVLKRGIFIYETPISYTGRTYEEGKKITWKDGFRAIEIILKYRFVD